MLNEGGFAADGKQHYISHQLIFLDERIKAHGTTSVE